MIQDDPKSSRLTRQKIRAATVRYCLNGKTFRVTRPVNKLIPVECKEPDPELNEITFVEDNSTQKINVF